MPVKETEAVLPDGRTLEVDDEFTLFGGGRFAFRYLWRDGSITCHGPVGSAKAKTRSFKPDAVKTIHRKRKAR
jgi:hypothetical protein